MTTYTEMKIGKIRIVLLALALLPLLSSCKLDEPESPIQELQSYEYRFSIVEETKALLNDNGVFWEAGDQVGLFAGSGASVAADVDVSTSPKSIVYSSGSPLSAGTNIFSYYPFQAGNTSASAAKITIPTNQQGGTQSAMPMAGIPFAVTEGQGTQGSVYFLNLGSVIDFRVYSDKYAGEQIESITLAVTSGSHAVSGNATIDLTSVASGNESSLSLTWPQEVASSVTLSQTGTVATSKETAVGSMLMVVAPGTYYSGTITIVTNVANYTFSFTDDKVLEFTRNRIKRFNMNLDNAVRNKLYFRLENDKMAEYLDYVDVHPYDTTNYTYSYVYEYSKDKSSSNRLDLPLPVTLSWISTQTGTMSAEVYYDSAHTQPESMVYVKFSSDAKSVDIYNLIPNRHYYYVIKAGAATVASGEFNTTGHRRIMYVADPSCGRYYANNCRDIGGLETAATDSIVKYGKIFRGSNMDMTTDDQKTYITNVMHVGLDVDLRYNATSNDGGKLFNALNLHEIEPSTSTSNTSGIYRGHTQELYNNWTDLTNTSKIGPTLTRIINAAAATDCAVYIHCKVGADRTGFVCLMLEAILGVKQVLCDVDYELTSFSPDVGSNPYRLRNDTPESWYYYPMGINAINDRLKDQPNATFQQKAIDYAVNVLGVPDEKINVFRKCMLEPKVRPDNNN